jgi:hypothetical protein
VSFPELMYVARDGNYGSADGLVLVDATGFTDDFDDAMQAASDTERSTVACIHEEQQGHDPIVFAWLTDNEAGEIIGAVESAVAVLIGAGHPALARQIGNVRDVLYRSLPMVDLFADEPDRAAP